MSDQQQQLQTGPQEPAAAATPQGEQGQSEAAPSEQPTVVPKQEPDATANAADIDPSIEQDIDMNVDENAAAAGGNDAEAMDAMGNPVHDEALPTSVDALAAAAAPSKKETSLREFLGKMDEYAPIVSLHLRLCLYLRVMSCGVVLIYICPDPRRRHSSLPHPRRPPTPRQRPEPNPPSPGASARLGRAEIHLRNRRRLVPVRAHPCLQQLLRQ